MTPSSLYPLQIVGHLGPDTVYPNGYTIGIELKIMAISFFEVGKNPAVKLRSFILASVWLAMTHCSITKVCIVPVSLMQTYQ